MTFAEREDALRGELARIGKKEFRRKYGPLAHVTLPVGGGFNTTKAILAELDREDEDRHRRVIERAAWCTAIFTLLTAIGVFVSLLVN